MGDRKKVKSGTSGKNIVDQDAIYTETYIENITDSFDESDSEDDIYELGNKSHLCKCPIANTPWNNITYSLMESKENICIHKESLEPDILQEIKEALNMTSPLRLKELTLAALNKDQLLLLKKQIEEVKIPTDSVTNIKDFESDVLQRLGLLKLQKKNSNHVQLQVFESACDRHNEPYMDGLYRFFPDDCNALDMCPCSTEMPWKSGTLRKKVMLRKMYKHTFRNDENPSTSKY